MINKLLISMILLVMLLIPTKVSAANGIRVVDSNTKIEFPTQLTFNLKADSPTPINLVRLRYQIDKATYAPSYAEAWPEIQAGNSISTTWAWDMRKSGLPPGAKITYWWVIQDTDGNQLTSPKETVHFNDTRYKWQTVSDKMITISWYRGDRQFASELLEAAINARTRLEEDTGVKLDKPVTLYIYANYLDLRGSIVASEEWTGGVAYAGFNIISIGIAPDNLDWGKDAVAHELGHLITHQVTASPFGSGLPPWLDEGLAMHAEGSQGDSDKGALRKAIQDGTIATLKSLSSPFSANPREAFYAYAQSQSVIEYLIQNFGKNKIGNLLILLNDGTSMDDALLQIYEFDLEGLDEAWMDWLMRSSEKESAGQRQDTARQNQMSLLPLCARATA